MGEKELKFRNPEPQFSSSAMHQLCVFGTSLPWALDLSGPSKKEVEPAELHGPVALSHYNPGR